jgi:hypothetical protein
MKLSLASINAMSLENLRKTAYKLEWSRCQAWKKYYAAENTIKELRAKLAEYESVSTDQETNTSGDDDEDSVASSNGDELPLDKNGKPKKWCEVCQKHISRDNFATHIKTTKKHKN